jgi:hypothetical protein
MLKNQEFSRLHKEYNRQVVNYNEHIERIIRTKFEMSKFWRYKKDYPADWKRMAEKLTADRKSSDMIKGVIVFLKEKMRKCNVEYNQK